jgi:hypothetical protein
VVLLLVISPLDHRVEVRGEINAHEMIAYLAPSMDDWQTLELKVKELLRRGLGGPPDPYLYRPFHGK